MVLCGGIAFPLAKAFNDEVATDVGFFEHGFVNTDKTLGFLIAQYFTDEDTLLVENRYQRTRAEHALRVYDKEMTKQGSALYQSQSFSDFVVVVLYEGTNPLDTIQVLGWSGTTLQEVYRYD